MTRSGDPRSPLELIELDEPQPGAGEVLVDVLVSPIGPMDRLAIRGLYPLLPEDGIPGAQGVGLVAELGAGVHEPEVGTVVLLPIHSGAWRERVVVSAERLVPLPTSRDPAAACTLRIEALTAALLLEGMQPGQSFIHSPGAGSVGRYLTVLGRKRKLNSIALVGSREPIAELWGLGADEVLVREPGLAARLESLGLELPRVAFDGSGGDTSELLASCLAPGGELVVYGAMSRQAVSISIGQLVFRDLRVRGFWLHRWAQRVGQARLREELVALTKLELSEQIVDRFTLEEWPRALELAEQHGTRGRVCFAPALHRAT